MNQRQLALYLAMTCVSTTLNLSTAHANDAQRVILLSCFIQIRALHARV